MLNETTAKHINFSLKKMRKLVRKIEQQGFKRFWEDNEIWSHYFIIVSRVFTGKRYAEADKLLSRSKAIPTI